MPMASEVIVVDSGSTDSTVSIAKAMGAQVHHQSFLGFGPQKNYGVQLAQNDWILSLDADEALSAEAVLALQGVCSNPLSSEDAFSFPRLTFLMGRGLRYGGHYPDRQVRFFNRQTAKWSDDDVHEKLVFKNHRKLKGDILHLSLIHI